MGFLTSTEMGHQIDADDFLRDIATLAAYIHAGSSVAMTWRGPERNTDHKLALFKLFFQDRAEKIIPKLLIAIAATLRVKIDDGSWLIIDEHVGWITYDNTFSPESGESINVREACNKIIHARHVEPRYGNSENGTKIYGAIVKLSGSKNGKPWCAEINLLEFCIAAVNTSFFDERE